MSTKPVVDYNDVLEVAAAGADGRAPEAWARATFEALPAPVRVPLLASWRAGLLLRLPTRDPERILGWAVVDRPPGAITIEAAGPLLTSHLTFTPGPDTIRVTTEVRYARRGVGLLWTPAAVLHRRLIPAFLRRATRSLG